MSLDPAGLKFNVCNSLKTRYMPTAVNRGQQQYTLHIIPPSPPESFNLPQHKDLPFPAFSAQLHDALR